VGRDVVMTNQIATVRQNLDLIVDNSAVIHGLSDPKSTKWGPGSIPLTSCGDPDSESR